MSLIAQLWIWEAHGKQTMRRVLSFASTGCGQRQDFPVITGLVRWLASKCRKRDNALSDETGLETDFIVLTKKPRLRSPNFLSDETEKADSSCRPN
jgi:hypothetical protein